MLHAYNTVILKQWYQMTYYRTANNYKKSMLLNIKVAAFSDIMQKYLIYISLHNQIN